MESGWSYSNRSHPTSRARQSFGDPNIPTGPAQFSVIQAMAPALRVEVTPLNKRDAGEIERAVAAFARTPNGGLIVTPGTPAQVHRDLIITLAARHKLPAVYFDRTFVAAGGLVAYAPDRIDMYRQAAGYVDRILKGEKPADMPVQAPTKYELTINLKTAKALGLPIPAAVLIRAEARCPLLALSGHADRAHMSAFGESGHAVLHCKCPLLTQSGHWASPMAHEG